MMLEFVREALIHAYLRMNGLIPEEPPKRHYICISCGWIGPLAECEPGPACPECFDRVEIL